MTVDQQMFVRSLTSPQSAPLANVRTLEQETGFFGMRSVDDGRVYL